VYAGDLKAVTTRNHLVKFADDTYLVVPVSARPTIIERTVQEMRCAAFPADHQQPKSLETVASHLRIRAHYRQIEAITWTLWSPNRLKFISRMQFYYYILLVLLRMRFVGGVVRQGIFLSLVLYHIFNSHVSSLVDQQVYPCFPLTGLRTNRTLVLLFYFSNITCIEIWLSMLG